MKLHSPYSMSGQTPPHRILPGLHPMVYFRADGVVNHDTLVYGVVCPEIGTTLEDGVAIYHPIGRYELHKRDFQSGIPLLGTIAMVYYSSKGVLEVRTPLLRKNAASSILTGMSRNATYPYRTKRSSPITATKRDAPKQGIPLHIISELYFTPHFYQNTSFSMFPIPSALLRWRIICGFQVRGIGRRNQ